MDPTIHYICCNQTVLGKMALWGFLSAVAIYGTLVDAIPTVTFPLNSQVPPVARFSELFSYTFSISTFSSTLPITYTLSSGPSWLSLDNSSRTLFGTPATEDADTGAVTGVAIDITASDSSGSITQNSTLVVSKNPAPVVSIPLSAQLQLFTAFSAPSTLLYHPSTPFTFNFQPGTFSEGSGGANLSYYAVTIDNTPLPSWLSLDGSSLTFIGQTPDYQSLIQPPQTFGIQLIASDVEGFSGASINFDIEVGVHLLAFKNAALIINATVGDIINFDDLATSLELDGKTTNGSNVASITARTPSWLAFDNSTLALSGTVPSDATPYNITIQATDIYGDTANAIVYIDITTSLFNKEIGTLNATVGLSFAYDLSVYLQNKSDTEMIAQFSPSESWLSFDSRTFILAGQVSPTTKPSIINVTLLAASESSHETDSQAFELVLAFATNQASPSVSSPSPTSNTTTTSQTGNSIPSAFSSKHLSRRIALAIVIPIIAILICTLLALFCYVRRRRAARRHSATPSKSEISAPLEGTSSALEIVRPPYVEPPQPLELDMTGFGADTSSFTIRELPISPKWVRKQDIRRSQTLSVMSGLRRSERRESDTSGNRARSHSDNALSKAGSSWRSTQDSAYPTVVSSRTNSSNTQRLTRNYSNYSRKGHTRRSARVFSTNLIIPLPKSGSSSQPAEDSILNLRDSNFSFAPIERFSVIDKHGSIQQTPDVSYASNRLSRTKSTRRQSRFMPALSRPASGIGHGGRRDSISSLSGNSGKRHSVGHGQDWPSGQGLARNSKTWLTIGSSEYDNQNRRSTTSALSEYAEMKPEEIVRLSTIRQVTKSPSMPLSGCLSASSGNSRNSRPVSRRVDSSPFFSGGSASRKSRRSPKKGRTSYADSPTVPEETTMAGNWQTVLQGLKEEDDRIPRDSFGISYGMAREGTRQLKSYVQSHLSRSRTRSSIRSTESKDSRFESASGSMMSLYQFQAHQPPASQGGDDEYEDYLPDDYSEGSWETHQSLRDSQGNVIEYSTEDLPQLNEAAAQLKGKANLIPMPLNSNPNSPMIDMGPNMRMVPGASRRPISVDAKANKRASKAKIERGDMDYTAYI